MAGAGSVLGLVFKEERERNKLYYDNEIAKMHSNPEKYFENLFPYAASKGLEESIKRLMDTFHKPSEEEMKAKMFGTGEIGEYNFIYPFGEVSPTEEDNYYNEIAKMYINPEESFGKSVDESPTDKILKSLDNIRESIDGILTRLEKLEDNNR